MPDEMLPFVPSRGCLGCPHRGTCHTTRQRLQDPLIAAGRHYDCPFYAGIQATIARKHKGTFYSFLDAALRRALRGGER